ncbi:hypothetical protein HU200_018080 [Digitaria exilis]|uniref:HMA domain-containing protein n=1 Tax=Digitaria exilis TaxID=1010633 RepID=A0A835F5L2_9POAL|nr:hypothetical protein HU200_018080 [Digitaria exilis]CAB3500692.1 unnamed protein product [Digitaria exilis]
MDESKKIVLKLDIVGDEGKATRAMSTVAKFCGVKSMAVDGEKGTLTVVGAVDVVRVAKALRKAGFEARVLSVGPEKEETKKPDEPAKKPADDEPNKPPPPPCCAGCSDCCPQPGVPVAPFPGGAVVCYEEPGPGCVII